MAPSIFPSGAFEVKAKVLKIGGESFSLKHLKAAKLSSDKFLGKKPQKMGIVTSLCVVTAYFSIVEYLD